MARRKSRAKEKEELIKALFGFFGIGATALSYYLTHSLNIAVVAGLITIGFILAILLVQSERKRKRLKLSGIEDIDRMNGIQFEHYLDLLFQSQGYSVKVTRAAGDYGADLVLEKDGKAIVVQAKRHNKNVGIEAVQQVHSSMNYYGASEAWVISNREYTDAAMTLARSNGIRLIDRQALIDMILAMNPEAVPQPEQILRDATQHEHICNRCGSLLVVRKGPRGQFYGCSSFPKCRNTKPM